MNTTNIFENETIEALIQPMKEGTRFFVSTKTDENTTVEYHSHDKVSIYQGDPKFVKGVNLIIFNYNSETPTLLVEERIKGAGKDIFSCQRASKERIDGEVEKLIPKTVLKETAELLQRYTQTQEFKDAVTKAEEADNITAEIQKLTQLQKLYLEGNQIKVIPLGIEKLTQIQKLDLDNNEEAEHKDYQ